GSREGRARCVSRLVTDGLHHTTVIAGTALARVGLCVLAAAVRRSAIAGGTAADDTVSDVAADVHTVAAAGGITRDVTSCHRTINVNTRSVTGGIARDSAAGITGQVAADIHTTSSEERRVGQGVSQR